MAYFSFSWEALPEYKWVTANVCEINAWLCHINSRVNHRIPDFCVPSFPSFPCSLWCHMLASWSYGHMHLQDRNFASRGKLWKSSERGEGSGVLESGEKCLCWRPMKGMTWGKLNILMEQSQEVNSQVTLGFRVCCFWWPRWQLQSAHWMCSF